MNINKILIVDDDVVDTEFFSIVVNEIDPTIEVICAHSKDSLFENLNKEVPDLLFIDSFINHESGHTGIQQIKADPAFANVPVIMYTGASYPESISKAFKAGAASYIVKPPSLSEIKKVLLNIFATNWGKDGFAPRQYYYDHCFHSFKE